jgi:hypothetical protein
LQAVIGDEEGAARAGETELIFGERNIHSPSVWGKGPMSDRLWRY